MKDEDAVTRRYKQAMTIRYFHGLYCACCALGNVGNDEPNDAFAGHGLTKSLIVRHVPGKAFEARNADA